MACAFQLFSYPMPCSAQTQDLILNLSKLDLVHTADVYDSTVLVRELLEVLAFIILFHKIRSKRRGRRLKCALNECQFRTPTITSPLRTTALFGISFHVP